MTIATMILFVFGMYSTDSSSEQYQISRVLHRVSTEVRSVRTLSYESHFKIVNSNIEDSIFQSEGKVWLERLPADSIFGCRFHVKGKDKDGKFDYYYDGQKSYEMRHELKQMFVFDPYIFPNNTSSPAKARIALYPFSFSSFLIDSNLFYTLSKNVRRMSILNDSKPGHFRFLVEYEDHRLEQNVATTICIDTASYCIESLESQTRWQGTVQTITIGISNWKRNEIDQLSNIVFNSPNQYGDYKTKLYLSNTELPPKPSQNTLIGSMAPAFSSTTFSGNSIKLGQFIGQVVLLDFWESWCGYCVLAFPKLNELQRKYDIRVIGITTENHTIVRRLIKSNKLIYDNIFVNKDILSKYHVSNRPTYILIGRDGKIIDVTYGDIEKIETSIRSITN